MHLGAAPEGEAVPEPVEAEAERKREVHAGRRPHRVEADLPRARGEAPGGAAAGGGGWSRRGVVEDSTLRGQR
jgi:hypothetical protein